MKRLAFSDPMMRALAAGQKTMTRRPEKRIDRCKEYLFDAREGVLRPRGKSLARARRPRCKVSDFVAATCAYCEVDDWVEYRFSSPNQNDWKTSRIMPADLAPFVLRITAVRAERLGEISEEDAVKEGMLQWAGETFHDFRLETNSARWFFERCWDHLYGAGAFERDAASWVWVYTFEVVERRVS